MVLRPLLALALALAAAGAAASGGGAPTLEIAPATPEAPLAVRVVGLPDPAGVGNASLKTCLASAGEARFCLLPVAMRLENGTWIGESEAPFPAGEQVGVNVSLYLKDGRVEHLPSGIDDPLRAYVFVTVAGTPERAGVPAIGFALTIVGVAALSLAKGRRDAD